MIVVVVLISELELVVEEGVEVAGGQHRDDPLHQPQHDQQDAEGEERRPAGHVGCDAGESIEEADTG